jgi:hypothetical protein
MSDVMPAMTVTMRWISRSFTKLQIIPPDRGDARVCPV